MPETEFLFEIIEEVCYNVSAYMRKIYSQRELRRVSDSEIYKGVSGTGIGEEFLILKNSGFHRKRSV